MSAVTTFESRLRAAWADLTTDVRDELEKGYAEVKAEVAQFAPLLKTFGADVKAELAKDAPADKAALSALLADLVADAGKILGTALTGV